MPVEAQAEEENFLGMSDEDFLKMDHSPFNTDAAEDAGASVEADAVDAGEGEVSPETAAADDSADEATGEAGEPEESEEEEADADGTPEEEAEEADPATEADDTATDPGLADAPAAEVKPDKEAEAAAPETGGIDYKAEYEKLVAPFRANGKELQVQNVDEALQLMQMGANYNKKMAALKPNLKTLKLLENNGLLDEQKLSFLIDLDKKNPEAIAKLIKDSGIDPMEVNVEEDSKYTPKTYTVDDSEVELDTVIDEIRDSTTYNRTLDIVSNKWDSASKRMVANNPQILRTINDHVANGMYDLISKEVDNGRVFGRLNGVTDVEAYRQMGDALYERGAFDHLFPGRTQGQQPAPVKTAAPQTRKATDPALKDKKRAASPTKPAAAAKQTADFNPLSLSDDEFLKLVNVNLM